MKKILILSICLLFTLCFFGQTDNRVIDSLKNELNKPGIATELKVSTLSRLSVLYTLSDAALSEEYANKALETAELSRDRKLIAKTIANEGIRYLNMPGTKENVQKSIALFMKALEIAKSNKLDKEIAQICYHLSLAHRFVPNLEKSVYYCDEAKSYATNIKSDSLLIQIQLEYGNIHFQKRENIPALRNYLSALQLAEKLKNSESQYTALSSLSSFYNNLKDYDKAIDYAVKANDILRLDNNYTNQYRAIAGLNSIAGLYTSKGSYDIAGKYHQDALKLIDSLGVAQLKVSTYISMLNNYTGRNEPVKALEFFNNKPEIKDLLTKMRLDYNIDYMYGYLYKQMQQFDSARYYFSKAEPFFQKEANPYVLFNFLKVSGQLYKSTNQLDKALQYFTSAKEVAEQLNDISYLQTVYENLDSIYVLKGDYKKALEFSDLSQTLKDSLNTLSKERDILLAEASDEQLRQERAAKEAEERKAERHNIQYRLIVISILVLITALIVFGMFKVSATVIRMLGFFTFLLFFEFIFLLIKKKGHIVTEGEPWKDLLLMIVLAAFILPVHHWIEEKVIHYLTSKNRLTTSGEKLLSRIKGKNQK